MPKRLSSWELMRSLKLAKMADLDANINRTECSGLPADCPLLAFLMDKEEICRTNLSELGRCMSVTPEWCLATLIYHRPKRAWWAGVLELPNGWISSSEPDLMESMIAIEHSHRICSRLIMTSYLKSTSMITGSLRSALWQSVVAMVSIIGWNVTSLQRSLAYHIMKRTGISLYITPRRRNSKGGGTWRRRILERIGLSTMHSEDVSRSFNGLTMTYSGRLLHSIHRVPSEIRSPKFGTKQRAMMNGLTTLALLSTFMIALSVSLVLVLSKLQCGSWFDMPSNLFQSRMCSPAGSSPSLYLLKLKSRTL